MPMTRGTGHAFRNTSFTRMVEGRSALTRGIAPLIGAIALLLLVSFPATAQTAALAVATATGGPGSIVSVPVTFSSGPTPISLIQFDLSFSSQLSYVSVTTGDAASAAGKSAAGNAHSGGATFLISGLNQNVIGSGVVAIVQLSIAAGATPGVIPVSIGSIIAADPSANAVPLSGSYGSVTVPDSVAPTVTITSPTSSGSYTATSTPLTVAGTASDNVGVTQVTWTNNRGGSGAATGTSSWSVSGIALLSGSNIVTVTARDTAGNTGTATLTVTYNPSDTTPPTVTITSPTSSGSYTTTSTSLTIAGTASDNVGVTQVTWTNNRGGSGAATGTSSWSVPGIALLSGSNIVTVTARDAAGNTGTATLTVTYNPSDTTPPTVTITSPTSSGSYTATSTPLTIAGTASDNVGVTQVTWTNNRGGSGAATGTSSWSVSGIALLSGSNLVTVTARDAAGNSASSTITVTYQMSDTTPPVISAVLVRLSSTTATVSWDTDEPASSQVEYGSTTAYGSATEVDSNLVTSHAQILTNLTPKADYHFRVKSSDSAGNLAVSPDYAFKTYANDTNVKLVLYYPSMSSPHRKKKAADQSDNEYTSIALTNLDSSEATVTFTAYNADGVQLSGTGITNPVTTILQAGEQVPIIDVQLFGNAIKSAGPLGWIELDSSTTKLVGFFMVFDNQLTFLDGADISSSLVSSFVLPEIAGQDFTEVLLSNPNTATASVRLDLMKADGSLQASSRQEIKAGGTLSSDLFNDVFPGIAPDPNAYLRVSSSKGLLAYETIGRNASDVAILSGQGITGGASILYSPQYAVGGPWQSTLSLVNLDGTAGSVALKLLGDNGLQIGPTRFVNIAGGGKVYISDQAFFDESVASNSGQTVQGYVEVTGIGIHLAGSVSFGDAKQGIFTSALPLVSTLSKSVIFSHVASDNTYFTGLAILNPNTDHAMATIDLYDSEGNLKASVTLTIAAGQRRSNLLTEYFPSLVGQSRTSGYFRVTASQGVACFALFGTQNLSVLSAIPAQPVP